MVNLLKCQFVKSAPTIKDCLLDKKQVVFLGRSNAGKSTLINSLTNSRKMAFVSKMPGRTQMLSYFLIDEKFYLVDAPGYGFYMNSKVDFEPLMIDYLKLGPKKLRRAYILVDARRGLGEDDKSVIRLLESNMIEFSIILTKTDKLNSNEKKNLASEVASSYQGIETIQTSIKDKESFDKIRRSVSKSLNSNWNN